MLMLKPNCECCDKDLPPACDDARICSFECTFCASCATERFDNRCPNCGGNFVQRPVRPAQKLARFPAVSTRTVKPHGPCTGAQNPIGAAL